jgi:hypothetical protein
MFTKFSTNLLIVLIILNSSVSFGMSKPELKSLMRKHLEVSVHSYEENGQSKAVTMINVKKGSVLNDYRRRFDYILVHIPELHSREPSKETLKIFELYPDTLILKQKAMQAYLNDDKLSVYFEKTYQAIYDSTYKVDTWYTQQELMQVASRYFYCDQVREDSTVGSHICIGINGIKEANWEKDFILLEAFCLEAIFDLLDADDSPIRRYFNEAISVAEQQYKNGYISPETYLEAVKQEVFAKMENSQELKKGLLEYYHNNENNLAFRLKK